ncbi:hypothetical protein CC86DRAFT_133376 [Ophiobolus disseminans]|uniref:Uncharacterized protein n=1 Tax=Ophiobolus disseminans TaxID=1469910 RepID=A0A6A7AEB2_9PLEO|nr:hypothetical protein CC86DRAFT_133376 [Ophiobolus disseminans]
MSLIVQFSLLFVVHWYHVSQHIDNLAKTRIQRPYPLVSVAILLVVISCCVCQSEPIDGGRGVAERRTRHGGMVWRRWVRPFE